MWLVRIIAIPLIFVSNVPASAYMLMRLNMNYGMYKFYLKMKKLLFLDTSRLGGYHIPTAQTQLTDSRRDEQRVEGRNFILDKLCELGFGEVSGLKIQLNLRYNIWYHGPVNLGLV